MRSILHIARLIVNVVVITASTSTFDSPLYTRESQIRIRDSHNFVKYRYLRRIGFARSQTHSDRCDPLTIQRLSFIPSVHFRSRYSQCRTPLYLLESSSPTRNDEEGENGIVMRNPYEATNSYNTSAASTPSYLGPISSSSSLSAPSLSSEMESTTQLISTQLEVLQTIILQQQSQIDTLLKIVQQQQQPSVSSPIAVINGDQDNMSSSNQMAPLLFQPLRSMEDENAKLVSATNGLSSIKKLKAMLFIDGTWLYYSINERLAREPSIVQKYGRGWQYRYDIDWTKLPNVLSKILQNEIQMDNVDIGNNDDAPSCVEVDLVQSFVYTSYKAGTSTTSYRYKMFQDLKKANFSVQMMETVGRSEKCVDIQLAVEIIHYATLENRPDSYDIALLLTGDKDLMPAIIRTRCKGKQVGLVSMRPGCNRALVDTPGLLDFDVIWMEDFLEQLLIPREYASMTDNNKDKFVSNESTASVSMYTLHKVVYDFIKYSQLKQVSSRDLGRYLKQISIDDVGGGTLLNTMKRYFGGTHQYLSTMGHYDCDSPPYIPGTTDYSYWISLRNSSNVDSSFDDEFDDDEVDAGDRDVDEKFFLGKPPSARLSKSEIEFFSTYSAERLIRERQTLYMYSLEGRSEPIAGTNVTLRPSTDKESLSIPSIRKVVDDFVICSGCERIISSDLQNYVKHLRVTRSCSLSDEIKRMYGNTLKFLMSLQNHYIIEPCETPETFWIQLSNGARTVNETHEVRWSDTERKFFMKYTVEPLIISRQRWYCDTLSAQTENTEFHKDSKSSSSSYGDMTVAELKNACREMGLALSGTKAALLERIQSYLDAEIGDKNSNSSQSLTQRQISGIPVNDESSTLQYFRDLLEEYLHAKGGVANSKLVGRYLAASKAFSSHRSNALHQMKAMYGSLNTFVSQNSDIFTTTNNRSDDAGSDDFGFDIELRGKCTDYE